MSIFNAFTIYTDVPQMHLFPDIPRISITLWSFELTLLPDLMFSIGFFSYNCILNKFFPYTFWKFLDSVSANVWDNYFIEHLELNIILGDFLDLEE